MKNFKLVWSQIKPTLPYLYFALLIISQFLTNSHPNGKYILIFLLPMVVHFVFPKMQINVFFGAFLMVISLYLVLAFLSDAVKIQNMNPRALSFVIGGILFISLNLLMSAWMMYGNLKGIRLPALK